LPRVASISVTLEIIVTLSAVASVEDKTTHWRYRRGDPTDAVFYLEKRRFKVLVTTDLASNGIHPCDVAHVINYDLWTCIHRVGRTGRAGARGLASTLVSGAEVSELRRIERA